MNAVRRVPQRMIALVAVAVVLIVVAGVALWAVFGRTGPTKITTYFDKSVGIYEGSEVRVLGVKVGNVDSVTPRGEDVEVRLSVDGNVDLPADVEAFQITPSVVPDRYIQLAPAYSGGEKLAAGAVLGRDRTHVPVEIDTLYGSMSELSRSLGEDGANSEGAVTAFVETMAENLGGNGALLGEALGELSDAAAVLADSSGDIGETVRGLSVFAGTLADHDADMRRFNAQMSTFNSFLAGEREDLAAAVEELSAALGDIAWFVRDNRALMDANIEGLGTITETVAGRYDELRESIALMPLAIANLINSYDAGAGVLQMRVNFPELQDPLVAGCQMLNMGKMGPGLEEFEALKRQAAPFIEHCEEIAGQITAGIKTPTLNLPFGIMSGDNLQRDPLPGAVPGNPSPRWEVTE